MKIRLRRNERYPCAQEAAVRIGGWPHKRLRAQVTDFSETGARVVMAKDSGELAEGGRVVLCWTVPGAGPLKEPRRCAIGSVVCRRAGPLEPQNAYGLRFDRTITEHLFQHTDFLRRFVSISGASVVGYFVLAIKLDNLYWFWHSPFMHTYSLVASSYVLLRLVISLFYKVPGDNGYFPKVSVCITAMNEEDCIADTIESCFASRYPPELFEVIAVDDGSTDRTYERMEALKSKYPRLTLVRFAKNKGKRFAMAEGAKHAEGEVLLYVDSDTFAHPEALYRMVQPFTDPKVGAVAGHILVNIEDNYISKMESVRYYVSHRINKAGEGVFGCVTCCSGAFSAYRKKAVLEVLEPWLNQKFLGVQATFGDDRSLTNFILRRYRVLYHDGARSKTKVPAYWMKFFKQQLRWKKSWSRETLVAARFMYHEHPVAALSYYAGVALTLLSPFIVVNSTFLGPLLGQGNAWHYLGGLVLTYLFMTLVCSYHTRTRYWAYGLTFAVLYIAVFSWQNYYAMMTVNKTKWGTR